MNYNVLNRSNTDKNEKKTLNIITETKIFSWYYKYDLKNGDTEFI